MFECVVSASGQLVLCRCQVTGAGGVEAECCSSRVRVVRNTLQHSVLL